MATNDLAGDGIATVDEALQFADITKARVGDRPMLLADAAVVVLAAEVRRLRDDVRQAALRQDVKNAGGTVECWRCDELFAFESFDIDEIEAALAEVQRSVRGKGCQTISPR